MGATENGGKNAGAAHNVWDAVVAFIVIAALVGLVVYLVQHYGGDTEKIAAVLGIAAPVLAAAFGVSIGYYSGNKTGQSSGRETGKQQVLQTIQPVVTQLDEHLKNIVPPVKQALASGPSDSRYVIPAEGAGLTLEDEHLTGAQTAIGQLKTLVEGIE